MPQIPRNFLRWFIFSVLVALVPLFITGVILITKETPPPILLTVLGSGQLLLISTAIAADAIGDLICASIEYATLKIIAGGGCVIALMCGALWYAANSAMLEFGKPGRASTVTKGSLIIFLLTVISAGACKMLTQGEKGDEP